MTRFMKSIKWTIIIIVIGAVLFWVGTLIKCEVLTHKYYDEFKDSWDNGMILEPDYFKVLNCDERCAEVYYVSKGNTMGNVFHFEKAGDEWKQVSWNTIWSVNGSASELIFPYWWHFIYGGL